MLKENLKMKMPSAISTWLMIVYFLLVGLAAFIPAAASMPWLAGIVALGVAVALFLGR
jgi:uncharacterized membrane protein (DUF485 family)